VDAALVLEPTEGAAPDDLGDHLLDPADARLGEREHSQLPALLLGVARVHAEEVGAEQGGLVAAGTGADLEHGVLGVARVTRYEQAPQLGVDLVAAAGQLVELGARQLADLGVRILQQLAGLVDGSAELLPAHIGLHGLAQRRHLLRDLAQLHRVGGGRGLREPLLQLSVVGQDLLEPFEHAASRVAGGRTRVGLPATAARSGSEDRAKTG
jgi:hypothetical protein